MRDAVAAIPIGGRHNLIGSSQCTHDPSGCGFVLVVSKSLRHLSAWGCGFVPQVSPSYLLRRSSFGRPQSAGFVSHDSSPPPGERLAGFVSSDSGSVADAGTIGFVSQVFQRGSAPLRLPSWQVALFHHFRATLPFTFVIGRFIRKTRLGAYCAARAGSRIDEIMRVCTEHLPRRAWPEMSDAVCSPPILLECRNSEITRMHRSQGWRRIALSLYVERK
jgi:hypothetical protein